MAAFKNFRRHSVVVYISSKAKVRYQEVSPVVVGRFRDKSLGHTIPKAVIVSADQSLWFASSKYADMKGSKEFSRVRKLVKQGLDGELDQKPYQYANAWQLLGPGNVYLGTFVRLSEDGQSMVLKRQDNGTEMSVPLDKLVSGAQRAARMMAGGGAEISAEPEVPVMESWVSAEGGKTITAKFQSLSGNRITLVMENGRTVTFDISKLSEKSQQRAKELAGAS
ncbi:hypothetical protein [Sulfuriroseicoccus oceanibius]|uniref:Uncharacterized protein n=1 Tax=Sulfuriroseicoccus oceanibius TaxID=2707525 RepID=A0A6B3L717_9BACT|nr:hypothetical protein [Sulfuriroseicoccus oceanibius]QQL45046.1 hypothetical protein G3M56_000210 [Sulfuriroseicoccus oceanibius]